MVGPSRRKSSGSHVEESTDAETTRRRPTGPRPSTPHGGPGAPGRWPGARRRAGRHGWPAPTPPSRSSAPRCAWPGSAGADAERVPWVNHLVDAVRGQVGLEHGVALPVWDALARGEAPDLLTLAQKAAAGSVTSAARRAGRARPATQPRAGRASRRGLRRVDAGRRAPRAAGQAKLGEPAPAALDLPHRRDRRHLRGHPAGPGRRPRRRRRHRRDPLHRAEPARLRARGRHPRGLRRHLRDAGELPAHAGRAGRRQHASSAATSG